MNRGLNEPCVPLLQSVEPNTEADRLFSTGGLWPKVDMASVNKHEKSQFHASAKESSLVQNVF